MDIIGTLAAPVRDPEARGLGGGSPVPLRVSQHDEAGGGRVWAAREHPGRAGQIPEAVGPGDRGEKRKEAGHRGDGLRTVGEG